ncbi:general transcription factor 3C polypeptide 6 [Myripristis murdjan]|uniref:General transcription factor IIIC, polypeptide 6, alpha n=1 Tax=Myripristis murdjan TaxID=586833 RepID=A0A667YZI1_9TELE|nr:general transcription factor 3C polypeptide 6 [Myripristis murdjan]
MEDEWEEEEQLVVVELSGIISNDFLSKCGDSCKILDIDSEKPMMQVGQYVFAGEYEDAVGTSVLFEEGPLNEETDSPELKYMCHTVKKLMMQRIFLTEKKEGETSTGNDNSAEEKDTTSQPDYDSEDAQEPEEAEAQMTQTDPEDAEVG